MTAVSDLLTRVADSGRNAAFVGYLPVGYPTVDESIEAMVQLAKNGCDIIEVGMPYSDPGMDGPVIQHAAETALENGVRTEDLFRAVEAVAQAGALPVVMTYWNIVYQYGVEAFAKRLSEAGGAGIITPDLIPDEAHEWIEAAKKYDLARIFLAAPSSTPERLAKIVNSASGFVYAASTMGVTGTRAKVDSHARDLVERLRSTGAQHVCVGLGVTNAEQVAELAECADGVIVGSALVKALTAGGPQAVGELAASLHTGTLKDNAE